MTLPQVRELFDYWRRYPPANELLAWAHNWKPILTREEEYANGAMSPEEFAVWSQMTGGKVPSPTMS